MERATPPVKRRLTGIILLIPVTIGLFMFPIVIGVEHHLMNGLWAIPIAMLSVLIMISGGMLIGSLLFKESQK